jgi:hypothetical protein
VRRFGGFGFVAHPDSVKSQLTWADWTLPFDGVEWLNGDSEWRNESRVTLARALFDYFLRPGPALASILDRPTATLRRWDDLTARRPVVTIAGHDAHGGIGRTFEDGRRMPIGGVPSYEASFRAFAVQAVAREPLSGDAQNDSRQVLDAIRSGRVFSVVSGVAAPGLLDFTARGPDHVLHEMGESVPPGPAVLTAVASMPAGAELVLFHNGAEIARSHEPRYTTERDASGAFRIEVQVPSAPSSPPVPWLVGNPIYFLGPLPSEPSPTSQSDSIALPVTTTWHVEKDAGSTASLSAGSGTARLEYHLGSGERANQFAALAGDLGSHQSFARIAFDGRSARPMRISVQLRYPGNGGARWAHSVFLDSSSRPVIVQVDRLVPADHQSGRVPGTAAAGSLLFVVDLTNAVPGDAGAFEISNLRFAR